MNKRLLSVLLAALLLIALLPAAALAEGNIVVNLGLVRAGGSLDLQMATTESGTASLSGGSLPDHCSIVTEERGGVFAHYLRGTPGIAGDYEFSLIVTDTVEVPAPTEEPGPSEGEGDAAAETTTETVTVATLTCSIRVLPAIPHFTVQDLECFVAEEAKIRVQAGIDDNGSLSYQWYANSIKDNLDGTRLEGKTEAELVVDTEFVGPSYYYCVVTAKSTDGAFADIQKQSSAVLVYVASTIEAATPTVTVTKDLEGNMVEQGGTVTFTAALGLWFSSPDWRTR